MDYQPSIISISPIASFFISCCGSPCGVCKLKIMPVFEPNEYFWKKHWEPVKDKEDKAQTFSRCVRKLMLVHGNLKDTELVSEDRFEYIKAIRGVDKVEEE